MSEAPVVWSVSEVNQAVRDLVENSLLPFWLRGEASNLTVHRSGHVYLSLKDRDSQVRAVWFGGAAQCRAANLQNGDLVEVFGRLTVYEVRGEYQFAIRSLRMAGQGDLQRKFEELKQKLEKEGLFDPARKRPIPKLPGAIGVVTSPTGAAIRDFLQIVNRRFPNLRIQIYPALVQGAGAAGQLARGIEFFNRAGGVDVIVLTRGGGSIEDLWPFNEEVLARQVAASRIPVISAVGHEIDFTIADFVADLRVPTPSAAAELVVGRREELLDQLLRLDKSLRRTLDYRVGEARSALARLAGSAVFREPAHLVRSRGQQLDELQLRMTHLVERFTLARRNAVETLAGRLRILDPARQLERGYAILFDPASGHPVTSVAGQSSGAPLRARLADGELDLVVK
jgi:exodeoxyribonuclease VII large subunit